jgi:hypothetical protein
MPAKPSRPAEPTACQVVERRKSERRRADEEVVLLLDDPYPIEVRGRVVDISVGGFRVAHCHAALRAGQQVSFHHPSGEGIAQVMWNRVLENHVESGFRILHNATL